MCCLDWILLLMKDYHFPSPSLTLSLSFPPSLSWWSCKLGWSEEWQRETRKGRRIRITSLLVTAATHAFTSFSLSLSLAPFLKHYEIINEKDIEGAIERSLLPEKRVEKRKGSKRLQTKKYKSWMKQVESKNGGIKTVEYIHIVYMLYILYILNVLYILYIHIFRV